jgi:hypothetical protein
MRQIFDELMDGMMNSIKPYADTRSVPIAISRIPRIYVLLLWWMPRSKTPTSRLVTS